VVGERQGRHAGMRGSLSQLRGGGQSFEKGVVGMGVQVNEHERRHLRRVGFGAGS
jgi:hypothetical protein